MVDKAKRGAAINLSPMLYLLRKVATYRPSGDERRGPPVTLRLRGTINSFA